LNQNFRSIVDAIPYVPVRQVGKTEKVEKVIEKVEDVLARLLWPSTVGVVHVLALGMVTGSSSESSERNDGLVGDHILHVFNGLEQVQSSARSGGFVRVLKVSSQIINSALSRYHQTTIYQHQSKVNTN